MGEKSAENIITGIAQSKAVPFEMCIRDRLPAFIASYMKRKGVDMEPKATVMLADFVGSDQMCIRDRLITLYKALGGGWQE